jgi:hypothetical protein
MVFLVRKIISLHCINFLDFVTDTVCVYCAVRKDCLNMIQVVLRLQNFSISNRIMQHSSRYFKTNFFILKLVHLLLVSYFEASKSNVMLIGIYSYTVYLMGK